MDISNSTEISSYLGFYLLMRSVTGLVLYPIFCFVGIPANIIGMIVLSRKKMRSTANTFLLILLGSNLLHVLNDMLYFICIMLGRTVSSTVSDRAYKSLAPYAHYLFNSTMTCTAWITVTIATERFICVRYAQKARRIVTHTRAVVISVFVVITTLTLSVPLELREAFTANQTTEKSETLITFSKAYNLCYYILRALIPIVIITVLSILILLRLQKTRLRKAKKKATKTLLLNIISFVVCILPDAILSSYGRLFYHEPDYLLLGIAEITDFLLLFNSTTNIILYGCSCQQFMQQLKSIFHCDQRRRRRLRV